MLRRKQSTPVMIERWRQFGVTREAYEEHGECIENAKLINKCVGRRLAGFFHRFDPEFSYPAVLRVKFYAFMEAC